ncbi:hypothetical protein [Lactobacillus sp. 3B(2020)]|uniref:hypothetical protein n=1 Tax=Lactobacillus sp. 3B(2020) TaxID=2695882 RepID=UPI0015DD74A8|nr:hypothetical protein [Lactobacillus sp. 3B(2020)]QLL69535.1 hypothetical protein GTO83_02750 [Lactobacillus sp. 3B(2020)]
MIIRILVFICAMIFLIETNYFRTHQEKMYFGMPMKHPENVKTTSKIWMIILALMTILALVAAFTMNLVIIFTTLILGCILELLMAISVSSILLKP